MNQMEDPFNKPFSALDGIDVHNELCIHGGTGVRTFWKQLFHTASSVDEAVPNLQSVENV